MRISLQVFGVTELLRPILLASFSLLSMLLIFLISPERPTSPKIAVSKLIGFLMKDEAMAISTAKSAAGSLNLMPPMTLIKTS